MSKIALTPNASGTGTFTIAAPNSNTDRTLTLPDEAGTVLTSASTSNFPAGSVLQVVSTTKTDTFSVALSGGGDESGIVTGLTASITPSSTSSKILVSVVANVGLADHVLPGAGINLYRGATQIGFGSDATSTQVSSAALVSESEGRTTENICFEILDTPATTSSITYGVSLVRQSAAAGTENFYINRGDSTGSSARFSLASTITVMEIAG